MSKPTTKDVLDHLMEHYNDLSVMSKQLLGVARQVLVTHDAILELTGSGPFELAVSRDRLRELIASEEDLPVEVGTPFSPHMGPGRTAAPFSPPDARRELIPVARFERAEDSAALQFREGDVFLRDLPPGPYVVYRAENPEAPVSSPFKRVEADVLQADYGTSGVEILVVLPEGTPMPDFTDGLSLNLKFTEIGDE